MSQCPQRVVRHQHSSAQLHSHENGLRIVSRRLLLTAADDMRGHGWA
jgi:hypothetical protein